jgi:DNA-directed RNA polymerase specialized sigma24 family protein
VALTAERRAGAARRSPTDAAAFEALLRALHPEPERAAEKYEQIRYRLRRFFIWHGARWPDELTDETFDRVAGRLAGGEIIRGADAGRYCLGVGRNILREAWRRERRTGPERTVDDLAGLIAQPSSEPDQEVRFDCLERCLSELGDEGRDLVLQYYEREGTEKIDAHRALAAQLGLAPSTLRMRLYRLRARLEDCVRHCLQESRG